MIPLPALVVRSSFTSLPMVLVAATSTPAASGWADRDWHRIWGAAEGAVSGLGAGSMLW